MLDRVLMHITRRKKKPTWDSIFVLFILLLVPFCSEEDRKWFMEAMQANTIDVVQRMKEITQVMKTPEDVLESQGVTPENIEGIVWSMPILPEPIHSLYRQEGQSSVVNYVPLCLYVQQLDNNLLAIFQICWMSYKSMWNPLTWQMVRFIAEINVFLVNAFFCLSF